jgi:hypothetical protein
MDVRQYVVCHPAAFTNYECLAGRITLYETTTSTCESMLKRVIANFHPQKTDPANLHQ